MRKKAFTIIELITVVGIIAVLLGILIPSLHMVRKMAKNTQQKGQFSAIELGLMAFRSDNGYFPPSEWEQPAAGQGYCGGQKLAEALVGWDLMGFHPDSHFNWDGLDDGGATVYDPNVDENLDDRRDLYVDMEVARPFRLDYLFLSADIMGLRPDTFVLCDVFGQRKVTMFSPSGQSVTQKAGNPILYYRANAASRTIDPTANTQDRIYDVRDNLALVRTCKNDNEKEHPLSDPLRSYQFFYDYITDPKVIRRAWPYRPDSYILISAGADGEYGTEDDICNF